MRKFLLWIQILWATALFAQPTGSCTTGTTKMGSNNRFYGCVEGIWKKLSEQNPNYPSSNPINLTAGTLYTGINFGELQVTEVVNGNTASYLLKNEGFIPITLAGHTHEVGKIIYDTTKKHFYQGVANGLWHQIDNEPFGNGGGNNFVWTWLPPGTQLHPTYRCNPGDNLVPQPGMWIFNAQWIDLTDFGGSQGWTGCQCIIRSEFPVPAPVLSCEPE